MKADHERHNSFAAFVDLAKTFDKIQTYSAVFLCQHFRTTSRSPVLRERRNCFLAVNAGLCGSTTGPLDPTTFLVYAKDLPKTFPVENAMSPIDVTTRFGLKLSQLDIDSAKQWVENWSTSTNSEIALL